MKENGGRGNFNFHTRRKMTEEEQNTFNCHTSWEKNTGKKKDNTGKKKANTGKKKDDNFNFHT